MKVERESLALKVAEIRQHAQYCSEDCCDGKIADYILSLLAKQQAEHEAILKKIERKIVEISIYDDHSSKCYNEIMELLKNVGV